MARRKLREKKSKFFGTKQVLKDMNLLAHSVAHDLDPSGQALISQIAVFAGAISLWPLNTAPTGFLECNGAAVSRTTYATLFGVIGTTFGVGDGSTTFNVPDMRDRFPVGKGTTFATIASTGGSVNHTHSVSISGTTNVSGATHKHGHSGAGNTGSASTGSSSGGSGTPTDLTRQGHSHNIPGFLSDANDTDHDHTVSGLGTTSGTSNPPYIVIKYIIKT